MDATPALDDGAVRWSVPPADLGDRPLIVLLHGYGSDENDLFGLVPYLPPEFAYAAVRAPLTPPFPAPGYSWYPIEGLDGRSGEKVTEGAARVLEWLDATGVERAGLLGFSQGGAVSLQTLRLAPDRIPFAVNLSGYVHPGPLPGDPILAERRDTPVFWGRGALDEVIPEPLVAHSVQWLPEHVDLSGRVYSGMAHSVSEQELHDVRAFLGRQLERLTAEDAQ